MLLTYLAGETDRPLWTEQARLVAGTVAARLRTFVDTFEMPRVGKFPGNETGFFGEAAGAVNFLLHAGQVLGDSELFTPVTQALPVLDHLLRYDKARDVVAGNVGLLLTMLAVHEVLPEAGALPIARSCADRLIADRFGPRKATAGSERPSAGPRWRGWHTVRPESRSRWRGCTESPVTSDG